jgi:hypothetical protein
MARKLRVERNDEIGNSMLRPQYVGMDSSCLGRLSVLIGETRCAAPH